MMSLAIESYTEYLKLLKSTPDSAAAAVLWESYLEADPRFLTGQDTAVAEISGELDARAEAGTITDADLGEYELAARRAGFFSGFRAAMAYARLLQTQVA